MPESTVDFALALTLSMDTDLRQLALTSGRSKASLVRRGIALVLAEAGIVDAGAPERVPATLPTGRINEGRRLLHERRGA